MLMYNMLLKVTDTFLVKPALVLFILGSFGCSLDREKKSDQWLCEDDDSGARDGKIKFTKGSFGLFQFGGGSTEWCDIYVKALEN